MFQNCIHFVEHYLENLFSTNTKIPNLTELRSCHEGCWGLVVIETGNMDQEQR